MDIILGEPRRRWSREDKLAVVAETFAPGAVVLHIARRHGISSAQIYTWRNRLRAELGVPEPEARRSADAAPATLPFLPLAIATAAPTAIEVEFGGGAKMKITGGVNAAMMLALVQAVADKAP